MPSDANVTRVTLEIHSSRSSDADPSITLKSAPTIDAPPDSLAGSPPITKSSAFPTTSTQFADSTLGAQTTKSAKLPKMDQSASAYRDVPDPTANSGHAGLHSTIQETQSDHSDAGGSIPMRIADQIPIPIAHHTASAEMDSPDQSAPTLITFAPTSCVPP